MTTSNIKRFDEYTGQVLGALYESFPVPRPLLIEDFAPDGFSSDDFLGKEVLNEKGEFLFACIDWLAESGYLRFKQRIHNAGYAGGVLTAKGLEVLKAIPDSVSTGSTLGEQLVDATKSGVKGAVSSVVGKAFSIGVKIASSHLGLPG